MTTPLCPACSWPVPSTGHVARCEAGDPADIEATALDLLAAELGAVDTTTTPTPSWRIG